MSVSGETLRFLRESHGLTCAEFAAMAKCAPSYVSMVERGQRRLSPSMLCRWLNIYGFELDDFKEAV